LVKRRADAAVVVDVVVVDVVVLDDGPQKIVSSQCADDGRH